MIGKIIAAGSGHGTAMIMKKYRVAAKALSLIVCTGGIEPNFIRPNIVLTRNNAINRYIQYHHPSATYRAKRYSHSAVIGYNT